MHIPFYVFICDICRNFATRQFKKPQQNDFYHILHTRLSSKAIRSYSPLQWNGLYIKLIYYIIFRHKFQSAI